MRFKVKIVDEEDFIDKIVLKVTANLLANPVFFGHLARELEIRSQTDEGDESWREQVVPKREYFFDRPMGALNLWYFETLGLNRRLSNLLVKFSIYPDKIIRMPEEEMGKIRGIGKDSIRQIINGFKRLKLKNSEKFEG